MNIKNILLITLLFLFTPLFSYSGEYGCLKAYNAMTNEIENAGSEAEQGNVCGAADCIERALNLLGTCEYECAYDSERMQKIRSIKKQLTTLLIQYVKQCGH